jgi:hypothetical protein
MAGRTDGTSSRRTRRRLLALAVAGGAAAAIAAGSQPGPAMAQASEPLIGSWMSVFTLSTGEILSGLLTFHSDGTIVNATSDHSTGTTSHGHWQRVGDGQYAYSVMRIDVDPSGNFDGFRAIDADVTLDPTGKSWTSVSRTNFYDSSGNFVRTLTSTVTAHRIPLLRQTDPILQNVMPS